MTSLAITVVGHDRPGIIARTAEILAASAMNLEDSSMTRLRGTFAMTLICTGDTAAAEVAGALEPLTADGLDISVRPVSPEPAPGPAAASYLLTVHGADRLGIVARLVGLLAEADGNITDLTTRLSAGLYVLLAEVDLSGAVDLDRLRAQLAEAAEDLGVEVQLRPIENDEL